MKFFRLACLFLLIAGNGIAQTNYDTVRITPVKITEQIYMLKGAGGNLGVMIGKEGTLLIDNQLMNGRKEVELARVRNEKIGFVFQFHYLLNEFNVLKNVMLPGLKLGKFSAKEVEEHAMEQLKKLGIDHLSHKMAGQISGGEKQRVAIARALINQPLIIMGDEPTGNLDKRNSEIVFEIFSQLKEEFNQTLLIVTHDLDFSGKCSRVIEMEDGRIIRQ